MSLFTHLLSNMIKAMNAAHCYFKKGCCHISNMLSEEPLTWLESNIQFLFDQFMDLDFCINTHDIKFIIANGISETPYELFLDKLSAIFAYLIILSQEK